MRKNNFMVKVNFKSGTCNYWGIPNKLAMDAHTKRDKKHRHPHLF